MELDDLIGYVRAMFTDDPEVTRLSEIVDGMRKGARKEITIAQARQACEELVEEGMLQPAGRIAYEATEEYAAECGHEVQR